MLSIEIITYKNYVLFRPENNRDFNTIYNFDITMEYFDSETKCRLYGTLFGMELYTKDEVNNDEHLSYLRRYKKKADLSFGITDDSPDSEDIQNIYGTTSYKGQDVCGIILYKGENYYFKKFHTSQKAKKVKELLLLTIKHYKEKFIDNNETSIVPLKQNENKNTEDNGKFEEINFFNTQFYNKLTGKISNNCVKEYIKSMNISELLKNNNDANEIYNSLINIDNSSILRQKKIGKTTLQTWLKDFAKELIEYLNFAQNVKES